MDVYLARQPIFDRRRQVHAYELLFRGGPENLFPQVDGELATSRVINQSLWVFGGQDLTRGKRAFINFTRDLILAEYAHLLPKEWVTVEVLETVQPEPEVLAALGRLKELGYTLALDDYVFQPGMEPLLELADIVKVDFLAMPREGVGERVQRLKAHGVELLAEKVETQEDLDLAFKLGFQYFQGYFFSRPVIVSGRDVPPAKAAQLRLLQAVNNPEINLVGLENILKADLSLSYKLLSFINSSFFGLRDKVTSLRQALVLLGEENTRKWVSLVVLADLGQDKTDELVASSLIRARLGESLAEEAPLRGKQFDLFILGLFSQLEALVGRPLAELLENLPISRDVKQALLERQGPLGLAYELILDYERGDWDEVHQVAENLGLHQCNLPLHYRDALRWSHQLAGADA